MKRKLTLSLIAITILIFLMTGCAQTPSSPLTTPPASAAPPILSATLPSPSSSLPSLPFRNLSPQEAFNLIQSNQNNPNFVILDVRTPDEFKAGHIANAINVDFYAPDFKASIAKLDMTKQYLVYCRSGARSAQASQIMADSGFKQLYNLSAGLNDWTKQGFPTVS